MQRRRRERKRDAVTSTGDDKWGMAEEAAVERFVQGHSIH
jgi:hypothetical protein